MKNLKSHNRTMIITLAIIFMLICIAVIAPIYFSEQITKVDLLNAFKPPSASEWFGTDALGRSVFARTLSGTRETLLPTFIILMVITVTGCTIGIFSGLIGGRLDQFVILLITVVQSFPSIILVIAIVGFLGVGLQQTIIAICMTNWTKYAYISRSITIQLKEESYIKSSVMFGNTFFQTIRHYYLRSLLPQIITTMSFDVSIIIMEISGLSFIGLGAQVPSPEWGAMINDGRLYIQQAPWVVIAPCIAIMITVLAFSKLGETIKERVR